MTQTADLTEREYLRLEVDRRNAAAAPFVRREIGRCAVKGCKSVFVRDVEFRTYWTLRTLPGGEFSTMTSSTVRLNVVRETAAVCHGSTVWHAVKGQVTDQRCGARCVNAVGPQCDCSCGGENHGGNHL